MPTRPDSDRRPYRILVDTLTIVGPIERVPLRHVPGDWVLRSTVVGRDVAESVEEFRRAAERRGDAVEPGDAVEDRNERITGALRS